MLIKLIALTTPLCIDSFLIAAAMGVSRPSRQHKLRMGWLFAGFEAGMPLLGLLIGRTLSGALGNLTEYVAIAILIGFGLFLTLKPDEEDNAAKGLAEAHGMAILALGLGISLDGLAIGFTYGLLKMPVAVVTVLIAVQAFVAVQFGFAIGGKLPEQWRHLGEKLANLVLVLIGASLLVQKLFF